MKKKKQNIKLVKKVITNKKGNKQTVYVNPDNQFKKIVKVRTSTDEKKIVTKSGDVKIKLDNNISLKEKYENRYPYTWNIMNKGRWILNKEGKWRIILKQDQWKKLYKENERKILAAARRYSFNKSYGEKYEESKAIANAAFVEGVNYYGKYKDKKDKVDFDNVVFSFILGRLKENLSNQLNAGIRIPSNLKQPFLQFKKVKENYKQKYNFEATEEQLAKILSKIWTKKTFYNDYIPAEKRTYGTVFILKDKNGKEIKKTFDIKKIKNDILYKQRKRRKIKVEKRLATWSDLTQPEKLIEKEKDRLPMSGYVSINKDNVLKSKEEKHSKKIEKINKEFDEELKILEQNFLLSNGRTKKEQQDIDNILNTLKTKLDGLEIDRKIKLNNKLLKEDEFIKKNPDVKDFNLLYNYSKTENEQYKEVNEKYEQAKKDYEIGVNFYKKMSQKDFEQAKENLETRKIIALQNETKRFNKDHTTTVIPGIINRIKEFNEILSIKELPLNLKIDNEEGDEEELSNIYTENQLNQEQILDLKEQHKIAKEVIKDALENKLIPVWGIIMKLRMGLHETSELTPDNLWGELKTKEEIIEFLNRKYKTVLNNPDKFISLLKKQNSQTDRQLFNGVVPFLLPKYSINLDRIIKDFDTWKKDKPKTFLKKEKLSEKEYKKILKTFISNKNKAKSEWKKWKKRIKKYSQEQSTKKYESIKKKYKVTSDMLPNRFVNKKMNKREQNELINNWKKNKPKIFYESDGGKIKYVSDAINNSIEIMRRIIPLKVVRNLLKVHRQLIDSGVVIEKSLQNYLMEF